MNWRPNPFNGKRSTSSTADWPRNGAILKGLVYEVEGTPWLEATAIQQAGTEGFASIEGQGKWMGFDGGPSNGGKWLHEQGEEKQ
eukprot:SAG22_NODE_953_length_6332_cov_5.830258_4_plen_85_part_00